MSNQNDGNRVLNRMVARELTQEEIESVASTGLHAG
jgi:hypothetical protein